MNKQLLLLFAAAAGAFGYWIPALVLLMLAFQGSDAPIDYKKVTKLGPEDDFDALIKGEGMTVVDFFTTWCPPCKMLAPKLADMSEEFQNVKFIAVDAEKFPSLASRYQVKCYPTIVFLVGSNRVSTIEGANVGKIKDTIQQHEDNNN
eukprot:TRINITY_DN1172_c0_g1_i1.p1 TRINITY_DN1172_c0_g1~~TRINITY_DN1172_c0_g1_i1.p1  ORF type:complete len:148 (+),score=33.64 TRINITY_DN1172_c0_g1_i1:75-518(+)